MDNHAKGLIEEFMSNEQRNFKFKIGTLIASSLSGFIAGAIFASIVWVGAILVMGIFG